MFPHKPLLIIALSSIVIKKLHVRFIFMVIGLVVRIKIMLFIVRLLTVDGRPLMWKIILLLEISNNK